MGQPDWERSAAVDRYVGQLRHEVGELRERVTALEKERDELLWALRWSFSRESRVNYIGTDDYCDQMRMRQYANNQRVYALLNKYAATASTATTAPNGVGA